MFLSKKEEKQLKNGSSKLSVLNLNWEEITYFQEYFKFLQFLAAEGKRSYLFPRWIHLQMLNDEKKTKMQFFDFWEICRSFVLLIKNLIYLWIENLQHIWVEIVTRWFLVFCCCCCCQVLHLSDRTLTSKVVVRSINTNLSFCDMAWLNSKFKFQLKMFQLKLM